jgi:DNA-directed RNA polymerase subunit K/omega
MPRNTSELAAKMAGNKFDLVLIASIRVRELRKGHAPKIVSNSTDCVTALQEIEQGFIGRDYLLKVK